MSENYNSKQIFGEPHIGNMGCPKSQNIHTPIYDVAKNRVLDTDLVDPEALSLLRYGHYRRYLIDYLKLALKAKKTEFSDNLSYVGLRNYYINKICSILAEYGFRFEQEKIDTGTGVPGYNKTVKLYDKGKDVYIFIRYYEDEVKSKNALNKQRVQVDLSGNPLTYLRANKQILSFLNSIEKLFDISVTRIDITMDDMVGKEAQIPKFYNTESITKRYQKLYDDGYFAGHSKVYSMGESKNPTIYIGKFRAHKTLTIYDKLQEARDSRKCDEPELMNELSKMIRYEFMIKNNRGDSNQVLEYILGCSCEDELNKVIGKIHQELMLRKVKFLKGKKTSYGQARDYELDPMWDMILNDAEGLPTLQFSSHRAIKADLAARADKFVTRNIGGAKFVSDYINEMGMKAFNLLLIEAEEYRKAKE